MSSVNGTLEKEIRTIYFRIKSNRIECKQVEFRKNLYDKVVSTPIANAVLKSV